MTSDQRRADVDKVWARYKIWYDAEDTRETSLYEILNDLWDRAFDAGHANFDKDRGAALTAMARARAADRAKAETLEARIEYECEQMGNMSHGCMTRLFAIIDAKEEHDD